MGAVSLVTGLLVLFQTPEMPKAIQGAQWEGTARSVSQGPISCCLWSSSWPPSHSPPSLVSAEQFHTSISIHVFSGEGLGEGTAVDKRTGCLTLRTVCCLFG